MFDRNERLTGQSASEQHSLGQGVGEDPQLAAQFLLQHCSPAEQSESSRQSEHWQSVVTSQFWSAGQLAISHASSQSLQPTS